MKQKKLIVSKNCKLTQLQTKTHKANKNTKQTHSNLNMVLSGYARLRYCNNFIPPDIQAHLRKNIGKNNRVVVADYLVGDNAKHNPVLPKHLNQKINQLDIHEKERFVQQCKNMLTKSEKETNYTARIIMVIQFFRYLNMREDYISLRFANGAISKCNELLYDIQNMERKYKEGIPFEGTEQQAQEFNEVKLKKARFEILQCMEKLLEYREQNTT